ncbi:hypothetical protein BFP70_03405 [Thioclava sp. SK-1]|uniref:hypothetical protein n=1 Tax=Thioclava sp. SK-1 TaxID=1889770 RepID=UPI000824FBB2|nr:hypothetical protein [Thioclava sp. SK-1]OCX66888.1 hypothetical protein BFP70_03405 [Thioclava sp. SK-1]
MRRLFICLGLMLSLAACAVDHKFDSPAAVNSARFVSDEPPSITLYTVVSKRSGNGGHSGLLINGSERVLYDPAGSWYHPYVPEQNDLHYGITERMRKFYIDYHARETWDVIEQKVYVSQAVADEVKRRAIAHGSAPKSYCANAISGILDGVPGFETVHSTFFPMKLSEEFGALPGVSYRLYHDNDPDNNHGVLMVQKDDPEAAALIAARN